jgi:hypothetical protein
LRTGPYRPGRGRRETAGKGRSLPA